MNDTDDDNFPLFITNYVADQIAQPSLFVYLLHFRRYISLQLFFFSHLDAFLILSHVIIATLSWFRQTVTKWHTMRQPKRIMFKIKLTVPYTCAIPTIFTNARCPFLLRQALPLHSNGLKVLFLQCNSGFLCIHFQKEFFNSAILHVPKQSTIF